MGGTWKMVIKNEVPKLKKDALCVIFVYLLISSELSRSSAPALHCSPRSPTRADPPRRFGSFALEFPSKKYAGGRDHIPPPFPSSFLFYRRWGVSQTPFPKELPPKKSTKKAMPVVFGFFLSLFGALLGKERIKKHKTCISDARRGSSFVESTSTPKHHKVI
jgi:hypothetical protein